MRAVCASIFASLLLAIALCGPLASKSNADINLAWSPSAATNITGYVIYGGTNSGNYFFAIDCPVTQTNTTVTNLVLNGVYYFSITATNATTGEESPLSNEAVATNQPATPAPPPDDTSPPPPPPPPPGYETDYTAPSGSSSQQSLAGSGSGTNGSSGSSSGGSSKSSSTSGPTTNALPTEQVYVMGIPPTLTLGLTNNSPLINILGTIGATLAIQSTTNIHSIDSWVTITNITLTNAASYPEESQTNQQPLTALDNAYMPASQSCTVTQFQDVVRFFRAVMPYDYPILAAIVLPAKGYGTRLISVNMPGITYYDVCYISQDNSYIQFDGQRYVMTLQPAQGSTIRLIATTVAASLNLNWTSASEFYYTNGQSQVLATVVETDPPSSDPVANYNNVNTNNVGF
jgi:hypothetical protein